MMKLHYSPISTYSQKTLMAFFEKQVAFEPVILNFMDPAARAEYAKLNPMGKVPLLVLENGWKIPESSIIIEYLEGYFTSGTRLIPEHTDRARQTRFFDRMADLYVNDPMTKIFFDGRKPEADRDPKGVAAARQRLDTAFALLDEQLATRTWLVGDDFTMADCALIPALAYCKMIHPFEQWKHLSAYAGRAMQRPSFMKVQSEAAPYIAKMM